MKIAIVKLSAMGDIVHAMVALQAIKKAKPDIQIDWIVEQGFMQVLEHNPDIDTILPVNLKALKKDKKTLFSEIKRLRGYAQKKYDLVIDAQGLLKSAITSRLLGKTIVGFSKTSIREGLASYFYTQKVEIAYEENVIERNIKVLCEPLGVSMTHEDILDKKKFLYFQAPSERAVKEEKYVLFVVGASKENKIYPKEKFLEVAKQLNEPIVVIWANTYEHEVALYLENALEHVSVSPKMNLNDLKYVIDKASLLIGGDTGPTHMAWALNVPSITLFGNTPAYRNTYTTVINKVLKSDTVVNPLKLDKDDFSIRQIEVSSIVSLAKELLDG